MKAVAQAPHEPLLRLPAEQIDWQDESQWIMAPMQARSRQTLEKVLKAATELFVDQGYDQTSIADISRRAGVSVGSIYKRFSDKRSILMAIMDGYRVAREGQIAAMCAPDRWVGRTAVEIVFFHVEIIFSVFRRDAGILRLMERQRIVDPDIYNLVHEGNELVSSSIARLLKPHAHLIAHDDLKVALRYVQNILRGAVVWAGLPLTGRPDAPLLVDSDDFRLQARHMALAYLGLATNVE